MEIYLQSHHGHFPHVILQQRNLIYIKPPKKVNLKLNDVRTNNVLNLDSPCKLPCAGYKCRLVDLENAVQRNFQTFSILKSKVFVVLEEMQKTKS